MISGVLYETEKRKSMNYGVVHSSRNKNKHDEVDDYNTYIAVL